MSGIEPDLQPSQGRVRFHYTSQTIFFMSGAGGIRTLKHLFLRQAAQPLAYRTLFTIMNPYSLAEMFLND